MRNVLVLSLALVACDRESETRDRAPPTQIFPPGTPTSTSTNVTGTGTGTGSGGEGGGGGASGSGSSASTGGSSSSGNVLADLLPICTCIWNVAHATALNECGQCVEDVSFQQCSADRAACDADADCTNIMTILLPGCVSDPPSFDCIETAFVGPQASLELARNVLLCYCDRCSTDCNDDPQCE